MNGRLVSFAGGSVAVEWHGRRAAGLVEFALGAIPAEPASPPVVTFRLTGTGGGRLRLDRNDTLVYEDDADGVVASVLTDLASRDLAEQSRAGLLLHAAALDWDGCGVLVPGPTKSGKTTLAAWLTRGGFEYLTDDLAFVRPDTRRLEGLARAMKVREAAWQVLEPRIEPGAGDVLAALGSYLVRARPRPDHRVSAAPELSLLLFARYEPSGDGRPEPMPGARAVVQLMEGLLNARHLDGQGFDQAVTLARSTEALTIRYRDCRQVEHALHAWRAARPAGV